MIVKVGDSLGETFGNFVGRLAATLEVLTPVIPACCAGVLIVHPILPDRDHSAMLTMVKDGNWFSPNPPMDADGRREDSGRGVRELQAR